MCYLFYYLMLEFAVREENAVFAEGDDAEGWLCADAADAAGVQVVNSVIIMLCRHVSMTKEDYICGHILAEGVESIHSALCAVGMAVEEDDFFAI